MSTDTTATRFTGDGRYRLMAWFAVPLMALLITVVGGYAGHWKWTGFQDNDTLWDWLNLVLLPITLAIVPLWPSLRRRSSATSRLALALLMAAFVAVVIGGYVGHWAWTGFTGNTLWDWLKLLLVPFALPLLISALFRGVDESRDRQRRPRPTSRD
jgi:hypothetical protein